jgi:hypothetical protein
VPNPNPQNGKVGALKGTANGTAIVLKTSYRTGISFVRLRVLGGTGSPFAGPVFFSKPLASKRKSTQTPRMQSSGVSVSQANP